MLLVRTASSEAAHEIAQNKMVLQKNLGGLGTHCLIISDHGKCVFSKCCTGHLGGESVNVSLVGGRGTRHLRCKTNGRKELNRNCSCHLSA